MIENPSATRPGIVHHPVSAEMASVNRGDYCVSKAGLSMAAKLFAVRLASVDITVTKCVPASSPPT